MRLLPLLALSLLVLPLTACAAPGVDIAPQPGDYAFLEISLRG